MAQIWISCGDGVAVGVEEGGPLIDSEGVGVWEPLGYSFFTLRPRRCRNGKVRWLVWVQQHSDGTFTKCNLG